MLSRSKMALRIYLLVGLLLLACNLTYVPDQTSPEDSAALATPLSSVVREGASPPGRSVVLEPATPTPRPTVLAETLGELAFAPLPTMTMVPVLTSTPTKMPLSTPGPDVLPAELIEEVAFGLGGGLYFPAHACPWAAPPRPWPSAASPNDRTICLYGLRDGEGMLELAPPDGSATIIHHFQIRDGITFLSLQYGYSANVVGWGADMDEGFMSVVELSFPPIEGPSEWMAAVRIANQRFEFPIQVEGYSWKTLTVQKRDWDPVTYRRGCHLLASEDEVEIAGTDYAANSTLPLGIYYLAERPTGSGGQPVRVVTRLTSAQYVTTSETGSFVVPLEVQSGSAPGYYYPVIYEEAQGDLLPTGSERGCYYVAVEQCFYDMAYESDLSYPDNASVSANDGFLKEWRIRNSGTCPWRAGDRLVFVSGEQMSAPDAAVLLHPVLPGESMDMRLPFTAPASHGPYVSAWQLETEDGRRFGDRLHVAIFVP